MALINYVEPVSVGGIFVGIGTLAVSLVLVYIFYRLYIKLVQYVDLIINKEAKYSILEESFLDKIAKEKGIDLNKELIKKDMLEKEKKSFRKEIEKQIYNEMFPENKSEKK